MTDDSDWRTPLLAGASPLDVPLLARNPAAWPGYEPRRAVTAWVLPSGPVAAVWDFRAFGGSFGEDDATALVVAAGEAVRRRVPLVTLVRSGGTRLQEGMAALVGIPRARLALLDLAAAGLPHLSVADEPTTGGVWIAVASAADLRVAVSGATVGFAGPRVVEAVTGIRPAPGSHSAESAYAAGLVDAVLPGEQVGAWLDAALRALAPGDPAAHQPGEPAAARPGEPATHRPGEPASHQPGEPAADRPGEPAAHQPGKLAAERPGEPAADRPRTGRPPGDGGWSQVVRARARTTGGAALLDALLDGGVALRAPGGDRTVAASVGRLGGVPVVGVAVSAEVGVRPTPDGYRLAARAYRLAGRLGLPVLSLVDTPGAEPGAGSEQAGIAPAMGEALDALLTCSGPTVALVHGEGGSGGALAVAAADLLLLTPDSYFAAIGPEGAEAALRLPAEQCAELMRITPADLLSLGAADAVLDDPGDVVAHLVDLARQPTAERLARRTARWSRPLPGRL